MPGFRVPTRCYYGIAACLEAPMQPAASAHGMYSINSVSATSTILKFWLPAQQTLIQLCSKHMNVCLLRTMELNMLLTLRWNLLTRTASNVAWQILQIICQCSKTRDKIFDRAMVFCNYAQTGRTSLGSHGSHSFRLLTPSPVNRRVLATRVLKIQDWVRVLALRHGRFDGTRGGK